MIGLDIYKAYDGDITFTPTKKTQDVLILKTSKEKKAVTLLHPPM